VANQKPEQFPVKSEAGGRCGFGNVGENRGNEIDPYCSAPQSLSAAKEAAEKVRCRWPAPKGASVSEELAVSLKRYPDTKPEFFRSRKAAIDFAALRRG
jgi:hypothetical protein